MKARIFAFLTILLLPIPTLAQISIEDTGLRTTGNQVYGGPPLSPGEFIGARLISPLLAIVGVLFLLLFVYGGFLWMTAGGNPEQVAKAKKILVQSVIGLVIMVTAYAVTQFVLLGVTGNL